jgi:outer membrane protein insertion porin family
MLKPSVRQPNIASGKMDILYSVAENDQSFVERIVVQGNNRTKDKVLRRELAVAPGEVYDSVKVDASKKRLENLGYFSKVDISAQDTAVPNRKDMVVTVEEQRTGSVTFGVGFSTVDSLLGFVELSQGNFDFANFPTFTGAGQKFRTRLQYGLTRRDFLISWTEPWFLDRQLSFGFDLFYNQSSYDSSLYDMERYGAAIRVGKALNQFWRLGIRYQAENIGIVDVDSGASPALKAEQGYRTKSSVRATLTYDSRDDLFLTRSGEKVEFSAEGAGGPLMGDTNIWKLELEGTKYFRLPKDLILSLGGATSVVDGYDDTTLPPLFDRLFIGGSRSIRGFNYRDVGPLDSQGEPFGGQTMAYANAEITFPIIDRVRGAVFIDGGFNNPGVFDYSLDDVAVGTGVGLRLNLPIGPLRLDLGTPLMEHSVFDPTGSIKFHFDVGYQF